MKFVHILGHCPCNVKTTINQHIWKILRNTMQCKVDLQLQGECHKKNYVTNLFQGYPIFLDNITLQCSSYQFPCMVTRILWMKNVQKCILMHSCLSNAGGWRKIYKQIVLPGSESATGKNLKLAFLLPPIRKHQNLAYPPPLSEIIFGNLQQSKYKTFQEDSLNSKMI